MVSFADVVRAKVAPAPVASTESEVITETNLARDAHVVEPEIVAAATNQGAHAEFHPTKATPSKQLSKGLIQNCVDFLLQTRTLEVQLNANKITKDMSHFKKFVVIAHFVGRREAPGALHEWISALRREVGEDIATGRDLGRGFFHITIKSKQATEKFLMKTPHHSRWSTSIIQNKTPKFNPSQPRGMLIPT